MIAFAAEEGTFVPTQEQHDLLRAALLDDRAEVLAAFRHWKDSIVFDELCVGSFRLMPLLYRNLQRFGIEDELLPRIKGIYRQVWFRNRLILRDGEEAVAALAREGIPTLLIKGAALAPAVYDELALRPMEDYDVVVPREHFARALGILNALGWRIVPEPADEDPHLEFHHALSLARGGAGEIDLHWWSMYGFFDAEGEAHFWAGSIPRDGSDFAPRLLSPPDQLLQVCAHASQRSEHIAPIRWAADAFFVLRRAGSAFDWERLVAVAATRNLSLTAFRCLAYLREGLGVEVPDHVLQRLRDGVHLSERAVLRLRLSGRRVQRWYAAYVWMRLVFLDGVVNAPRRLKLFLRYLRSSFRVPERMPLAWFIAKRIVSGPVAPAAPNRETTGQ